MVIRVFYSPDLRTLLTPPKHFKLNINLKILGPFLASLGLGIFALALLL